MTDLCIQGIDFGISGFLSRDWMVTDPDMELSGMIDEYYHPPANQSTLNTFKFQGQETCFGSSQNRNIPYVVPHNHVRNGCFDPPMMVPPEEDDSLAFSEIESDITLTYISRMLLEEDIEDKFYLPQGDSALLAAEKPFLEILGEKLLPPPSDLPPHPPPDGFDSPDDGNGNSNNSSITGLVDNGNNWIFDLGKSNDASHKHTASIDYPSPSSFSSSNNNGTVIDRVGEFHASNNGHSNILFESQPVWQFNRGVEEANKFLPDDSKLTVDMEINSLFLPHNHSDEAVNLLEVMAEEAHTADNGTRGRKNFFHEDILDMEDGRSVKQSAVSISSEESVRSPLFDEVLLCPSDMVTNQAIDTLGEILKNEVSHNSKCGNRKGSGGVKSRGKKQVKKEVIDLRTLLIHCAQSVATDDHRNATELLKQIRQHSSSFGDGPQRLAQIFTDGLEARLAGTGSQIYHSLMAKRQSATDILKAHHLYLAACPFNKISYFIANQTILRAAEHSTILHIIDFGIYFGFQWPCLIQKLSVRDGGPPMLRITGIDVPQPGFRPNERIENTGRRLADYAQSFNVPFEYQSIASKWEDIKVEDLNIKKDEVLVVNCLYRFRNLVDETVVVDSPRDVVLNNIRKMNPDVFIHGVVNGAYSAPFFVTRFREALFHYSSLFDMLDSTVPREHSERLLIEREIFGREAINVIACEGAERVERPETYKQWQARNLRAGFTQLPLNTDVMKKAKDRVKTCYNKNFVIDADNRWLLQGWKGRIIYCLSVWKPIMSEF